MLTYNVSLRFRTDVLDYYTFRSDQSVKKLTRAYRRQRRRPTTAPIKRTTNNDKPTAQIIGGPKRNEISQIYSQLWREEWRKKFVAVLYRIPSFAALLLVTKIYVADIIFPIGPSMFPTIPRLYGNVILIDKITPRLFGSRAYCRNDVVVAVDPTLENEDEFSGVCKRIIAIGGESIFVGTNSVNSKISTNAENNGFHSNEKYSRIKVIPHDHVWLEGDSPENSIDSRSYGPVPLDSLIGRACLRLWPLPLSATCIRNHQ